jgi:16S rRNA (cytosine967-C5)-methyltransferase
MPPHAKSKTSSKTNRESSRGQSYKPNSSDSGYQSYNARRELAKDSNEKRVIKTIQAQDVADLENLTEKVLKFEYPADQCLKFFFKQHPRFGKQQRFVISEVIFDLLRHYNFYQYWAIDHFNNLKKNYSDVIPMSSTSWRRLFILALANAKPELINILKNQEQHWVATIIKSQAQKVKLPEHVKYCLPEWLWQTLQTQYDEPWLLAQSMLEKAPLDVRVNRIKTTVKEVIDQLVTENVICQKIDATSMGIRLQAKKSLYHHPLFEKGHIEIQDAASQIAAGLLNAKRGEMVVDFCAGAGGKTLAIGANMEGKGRIYAVDISDKRLEQLKERLKRSDLNNVYTMLIQGETDARLKKLYGKIDKVFVDVPCSGSGTFRRNPDLKWRYGVANLQILNNQQLNILTNASKLLKQGGRLVYATCSIFAQENEQIIESFLSQNPDFKLLNVGEELYTEQQAVLNQKQYLKLLPHIHQTDGFFAAVLEKIKT